MTSRNGLSTDVRRLIIEYQRVNGGGSTEYDRKIVYRVECSGCYSVLSDRCMRAVLLSDRTVDLYSTDLFPNSVGFVNGDYSASYCACRVRDIGCLVCGKVLGYHVNLPCKTCLTQENNGHYWMFRSSEVRAQAIFIEVTETMDFPLYWAFVRATDNYGGEFFEGDGTYAAKLSCKLAVKLPASIPLFVREPRQLYIEAYTNDNKISHYQFANYSR
ncbi:hypothetical protein G6F36_003738 [Rhizopus arrhizus]|nr:hypothetical protein G6F36_003738 [Rhizopus arrhizus]